MLDVVLLEVHALELRPFVGNQVQLQCHNTTRVAEANRNDQRFGRLFVEAKQGTFVGQIDEFRGFFREKRRLPLVESAKKTFCTLSSDYSLGDLHKFIVRILFDVVNNEDEIIAVAERNHFVCR